MSPYLEQQSQLEGISGPIFWDHNILPPWENGATERKPIEQTPLCNGHKDVEVDITGCKEDFIMVKDSCNDIPQCSSSFDDTGSGSENDIATSFNDQEVESQMCSDIASSSMCDDQHEPLRPTKKMVTDHWRSFISPIMWRCKWIELQLIQLQAQERKYCEELAKIDDTKQLDYVHLTLDDSGVKSVPISGRMRRNKVMKRRKRKRVEEDCDLASYMSNHNIFSYYEKGDHNVDFGLKDCHKDTKGAERRNIDEAKLNDLFSSVENDKSWYDIIEKIEAIQTQVQDLKNRHDKVTSENPSRFCCAEEGFDSFAGNASLSNGIVPLIGATDMPKLDDPRKNSMDEDLIQYEGAKEKLYYFK